MKSTYPTGDAQSFDHRSERKTHPQLHRLHYDTLSPEPYDQIKVIN